MRQINLFIFAFLILFSCDKDDAIIINYAEEIDRSNCDFVAPIYEDLSGEELNAKLLECFEPTTNYSYTQARNFLYSNVDVVNGNLKTLYSNYSVRLSPASGESYIQAATASGINAEHVFPQSQGAGALPARADMYNLFPEIATVNSMRGNKPFGTINTANVDTWFKEDMSQSETPSDPENWAKMSNSTWEPSDNKKGDVARAVFYFALIYSDVANSSYFEGMKSTLLEWNEIDPVDQAERNRLEKINGYQGNYNPFILDEGLASRLF